MKSAITWNMFLPIVRKSSNNMFLIGPIPASFSFIFVLFLITIWIIKLKNIAGVLGIRTCGRRMAGADDTTELRISKMFHWSFQSSAKYYLTDPLTQPLAPLPPAQPGRRFQSRPVATRTTRTTAREWRETATPRITIASATDPWKISTITTSSSRGGSSCQFCPIDLTHTQSRTSTQLGPTGPGWAARQGRASTIRKRGLWTGNPQLKDWVRLELAAPSIQLLIISRMVVQ